MHKIPAHWLLKHTHWHANFYLYIITALLQERSIMKYITLSGSGSEGWRRWALVSPDGVAPSRMVGVFASVNLPLHHKVQKFSSGTGSPGWSRKKGCKMVVVVVPALVVARYLILYVAKSGSGWIPKN